LDAKKTFLKLKRSSWLWLLLLEGSFGFKATEGLQVFFLHTLEVSGLIEKAVKGFVSLDFWENYK